MVNLSENNKTYTSREEYIESLKQWLDNARQWEKVSKQFYSSISTNNLSSPNSTLQFTQLRNNNAESRPPPNGNLVFLPGIYEFVIPPLWKRVVAEVLDFGILFIIKILLTFASVETFNFVTFGNYSFDTLEKYMQNPKLSMQMTLEILSLEILHRCIVCSYEVYWLKGGQCATPGKKYMGLMVIQIENIYPAPGHLDNVVRVSPCTTLGLQHAMTRAILKNLFVGFMLPVFYTMYIFRFNRTGYDIISKSIVVEYNPNMHPIN